MSLGDESSPRGRWGICAPALPEVLTRIIICSINKVMQQHSKQAITLLATWHSLAADISRVVRRRNTADYRTA
jgi:hypothetical protein